MAENENFDLSFLSVSNGIQELTGFSDDEFSNRKISILIVDDNEINRFILESILKRLGYYTISANNGLDAIEKLETEKHIHIVLTDLKMPRLDGYELTKYIREKYSADIPVIAISAEDPGETENKALSSGCNEFISKPYTGDHIRIALTKYI